MKRMKFILQLWYDQRHNAQEQNKPPKALVTYYGFLNCSKSIIQQDGFGACLIKVVE